uniref:L-Fucosyltransferase n=1 Tax=Parascaris univalens TaxID=6257 RepID=A0A915BAU5_PARUN
MAQGKCCVYNGIDEIIKNNDAPDIFLKGVHFQSFKYFRNISDEIRSSILLIDRNVAKIGRNDLLGGVSLNATNHRLCTHIRRGDFIASPLHMESREDFTVWAVRHVTDEKLKETNVTVVLFGNDRTWSLNVAGKYFNNTRMRLYVTNAIRSATPAVDFAFVQYNCDSVILTASASTFGWWTAFLAGPHKNIYYNTVFSKPNGIEKELNVTDFFPPEWIPLTMPSDFRLPTS